MVIPSYCPDDEIIKVIDDIIEFLELDFVKEDVDGEFLVRSELDYPPRLRRARPIAVYRAPYSSLLVADVDGLGLRAIICSVPDIHHYPVLDSEIISGIDWGGGTENDGAFILHALLSAYFDPYYPFLLFDCDCGQVFLHFDPFDASNNKMRRPPIVLRTPDRLCVNADDIREIVEFFENGILELTGVSISEVRRGRKLLSKPVPAPKIEKFYANLGLDFRIVRAPSAEPPPQITIDDIQIEPEHLVAFETPFNTKLVLSHDPTHNLYFLSYYTDDPNQLGNTVVSRYYFPLRVVILFAFSSFLYPYRQFMSVFFDTFTASSMFLSVSESGVPSPIRTEYPIILGGSFRRNGALGVSGFRRLVEMADAILLWGKI